jgi:hypothetical protein
MQSQTSAAAFTALVLLACQASGPTVEAPVETQPGDVLTTGESPAGVATPTAPTPPVGPRDVWESEVWLRAGHYDPATETLEQFRLRKFRRLIAEFEGQEIEQPDWSGIDRESLAMVVLIEAIRAHLTAAGRVRAIEFSDEHSRGRAEGFQRVWTIEGMVYAFQPEEFPAYQWFERLVDEDPATQVPLDQPLPPRGFFYPEQFFLDAAKFAREGWCLRAGG